MTSGFQKSPACIWLRGARAAYVGPGLDLEPHRSAVAVIAFALQEPFDLEVFPDGDWAASSCTAPVAVIPPSVLHQIRARGPMAFLYLDAIGDDELALGRRDLRLPTGLDWKEGPTEALIPALWESLDLPVRAAPDPRIVTVLRALEDDPDAFVTFDGAAREAGLSVSRTRELIRKAVGIPFRRYRLWRRMAVAGRVLARSATLTEAAHAAGFASSAHFSTAFRAMFGLSPSGLLRAGVRFDVDGMPGAPAFSGASTRPHVRRA
jgi:AraC-like DNA-binding protein